MNVKKHQNRGALRELTIGHLDFRGADWPNPLIGSLSLTKCGSRDGIRFCITADIIPFRSVRKRLVESL